MMFIKKSKGVCFSIRNPNGIEVGTDLVGNTDWDKTNVILQICDDIGFRG